jgi:hypothetical protein
LVGGSGGEIDGAVVDVNTLETPPIVKVVPVDASGWFAAV